MGSEGRSVGEVIESGVVDVEYAMKRTGKHFLLGLEKRYMNIETFPYALRTDAVTKFVISAMNPLGGADLLNRSAPRRTVRCRLEHQKSG